MVSGYMRKLSSSNVLVRIEVKNVGTVDVSSCSVPERSGLGPATGLLTILAVGLLSRFALKGRRTKKALSSVMAAIIFLALVFPMVISIILFVPRLNQAIKTSSDV